MACPCVLSSSCVEQDHTQIPTHGVPGVLRVLLSDLATLGLKHGSQAMRKATSMGQNDQGSSYCGYILSVCVWVQVYPSQALVLPLLHTSIGWSDLRLSP